METIKFVFGDLELSSPQFEWVEVERYRIEK